MEYSKEGVTQKTMARLANVSPSAISKNISTLSVSHIESEAQRNLRYSVHDVRQVMSKIGITSRKIAQKRHVFYNFKGGTGKTSMCYQVATHLALMGYKVLAIDADPQAHLSVSLGYYQDSSLTLYDALVNNHNLNDIIKTPFEGLDCIPANLSLTKLEAELSQMPKREERFARELKEIDSKYDFVMLDTNPTISLVNRNAVTYADTINIVCETQPYSLNGLKLVMEDLQKFFHFMGMDIRQINIVPNKYEDRTANSAEAMTVLKQYYSQYLKPDFAIRKSEDLITSAKNCKPLAFFAKKNSIALEDIVELIHYLVARSVQKEN